LENYYSSTHLEKFNEARVFGRLMKGEKIGSSDFLDNIHETAVKILNWNTEYFFPNPIFQEIFHKNSSSSSSHQLFFSKEKLLSYFDECKNILKTVVLPFSSSCFGHKYKIVLYKQLQLIDSFDDDSEDDNNYPRVNKKITELCARKMFETIHLTTPACIAANITTTLTWTDLYNVIGSCQQDDSLQQAYGIYSLDFDDDYNNNSELVIHIKLEKFF
jgi:hypothetical protein